MYSSIGKKKTAAQVILFLINTVVLALSARVNAFQEYFFFADLFPFILSIVTLVLLGLLLLTDFNVSNAYTARAPFEIGFFSVLSVLWLVTNAFSTSRWRHVPMNCGAIPPDLDDVQEWCKSLQSLKAFVWVEWIIVLGIAIFTIQYTIAQYTQGRTHIFKSALSRYEPNLQEWETPTRRPDSEFIQWEKRF